jgi:hypothetical protein
MVQRLLETAHGGVDVERVLRRTEHIWQSDRWMTASAWRATAEYVAEELRLGGAHEVEIFDCPADGESVFFGQKMWPVWEVRDATLETVGTDPQMLCHYRRQPRDLLTFSPPTPPGGIDTELVMVDDGRKEEHYRGLDVAGKIILTREHGGEVVPAAAKMGAVGIVSDFIVTRDSPYLTPWMPVLTLPGLVADPPDWDQHQQWMHISDYKAGLFGFSLSRSRGDQLRTQLRSGPVRVRAIVDAEFSKGSHPVVTGLLQGSGRSGEQVLVVSHLFEQGANDNASGCAVSLEVASCLGRLVAQGALPRPRRSIRFLYGLEMQAAAGYLHAHRGQIEETIAGLCLDCVGADPGKAQSPMCLSQNPKDRPAFTDPLLEWLARSWLDSRDAGYQWTSLPYDNGTDNFIAEKAIGIPCPWLGQVERVWHTTADTADILDRRSLTHASVLGASYCYYLAKAGSDEAQMLLDLSERFGRRRLLACVDACLPAIFEQKRGRDKQIEAAIALLCEERDRCTARLETVLAVVGAQQRNRTGESIRAARARLRRFSLNEERALLAFAHSAAAARSDRAKSA